MSDIPKPQPLDLIVIAPMARPNSGIDFREQLDRADAQVRLALAAPKLLHALQHAQRHLAMIDRTGMVTSTCGSAAKLARMAIAEAGGEP